MVPRHAQKAKGCSMNRLVTPVPDLAEDFLLLILLLLLIEERRVRVRLRVRVRQTRGSWRVQGRGGSPRTSGGSRHLAGSAFVRSVCRQDAGSTLAVTCQPWRAKESGFRCSGCLGFSGAELPEK